MSRSTVFLSVGDLLYIDVITREDDHVNVTSCPSGFFVNRYWLCYFYHRLVVGAGGPGAGDLANFGGAAEPEFSWPEPEGRKLEFAHHYHRQERN